jgi:hypothetical protein
VGRIHNPWYPLRTFRRIPEWHDADDWAGFSLPGTVSWQRLTGTVSPLTLEPEVQRCQNDTTCD